MPDLSVAVVGGGITGLATAWYLRQAAPDAAITVYEAGDRLGGKIRTAELAGVPVEEGPDTFLARVPWAVDLCRDLGLEADLVPPATGRAYVWTRGRLRPLPEGSVLGVPYRLGPLARSGIVSPAGTARAALDVVLPARRFGDDPSVADVVGARFGREVVNRLVEPLLGGIYAGRADRLSLTAVAPQVAGPAASGRSLLLGLRRAVQDGQGPALARGGPVFLGIRGGLERLVDRLVECLDKVDVRLRVSVSVRALADLADDRIVLTVPAYAAAGLVPPDAARELEAIDYASVVTATLAYPPDAVSWRLEGSGFLVPRVDGRLMTACTWSTSKWGRAAAPADGLVLLRASAGRIGDERALGLSDEELVDRLHAELAAAMGLRRRPETWLVSRWARALPQYDVGHQARVERIEARLPAEVFVAGAAYGGVGIAACIRQARDVAARVAGAVAPARP